MPLAAFPISGETHASAFSLILAIAVDRMLLIDKPRT